MFCCVYLWLESQDASRAYPAISSAMTNPWDVIVNCMPDDTHNGGMRSFNLSYLFGGCSCWLSKNYFWSRQLIGSNFCILTNVLQKTAQSLRVVFAAVVFVVWFFFRHQALLTSGRHRGAFQSLHSAARRSEAGQAVREPPLSAEKSRLREGPCGQTNSLPPTFCAATLSTTLGKEVGGPLPTAICLSFAIQHTCCLGRRVVQHHESGQRWFDDLLFERAP